MKSTLLHLRIPFSFFLMPVFWFALSQSSTLHTDKAILVFILLHLLIYPASNAYNSFYDKDESSIGGLENPPPVTKDLYYTAWCLDIAAIILAWFFDSWILALGLFLYSTVSKAYSYDKVRLKKYPIISWLTVGVFQGGFTYLLVLQSAGQLTWSELFSSNNLLPAVLSTCNLLGFYPMTQVYQHEEDAKRGDLTISRLLGIRGTFLFTAGIFSLVTVGFYFFFAGKMMMGFPIFLIYLLILSPVLLFFNLWFIKVLKNEAFANFKNTMILNFLGGICLNAFFILIFLKKVKKLVILQENDNQ
ncbi:UbiA family prenyltransferase [Flectobacillus sp. BAB-3569]|uniref:UbiA family prenyltransferase n=1 Tax=Flectobacillus sp. BAB-3569 TaxID=1509483 RepID=UPI000BA414F7|nr:UbiA family prenyltransferase [Flectobacillus sp. BAB-3569]PAC32480.1 ubiquinone biosynthesis protein UbiA [Flectobacillus sp. BAB-3569]